MKRFILIALMINICCFSQHLNLEKINNRTAVLNRNGKQAESQKILLGILQSENIGKYDKAYLYFLLGSTFRSIGDYQSSIKYLNYANKNYDPSVENDSLKMNIVSEIAFAYFDDNNYIQSEKASKYLEFHKYRYLDKERYAYIIMQKGYINFLNKNFKAANQYYIESENVLKNYSPCNQTAVIVKRMQLYAAMDKLLLSESMYEKSVSLADSCGILKYKIYATDEMKNICLKRNNKEKVFLYTKILDSLTKLDSAEKKLEKMHVINETYLEKKNVRQQSKSLIITILLLVFLLSALWFVMILYKKSLQLKEDKSKSEKELKIIKRELEKNALIDDETGEVSEDDLILLNRRQKELLLLVAQGHTNKEIAARLFISEATVKYHLKNIYTILNIKNRKDILMKSYKR